MTHHHKPAPQPMQPKRGDATEAGTLLRLRQLQTAAVAARLWKEVRNAAAS